ncbi:MAG TPA: hypothetical protein DD435_11240 [Cyanobacteria bacterium UBA8530]|nr:hypothetical protein [Cyanobacteria bacterium UBA8530]
MSGKKSCLILSFLIAAILTGCGGNMNYAAATLPDGNAIDTSANSTDKNIITATPTPMPTATPIPIQQGKLDIRDVTQDTKGILFWKKLITKGRVFNSGSTPLSGTLQVAFSKSGTAGDTQTKAIDNLSPGQSMAFEFTSAASADAGNLSILGQR